MNFIDRTALGETLAGSLQQYNGKDAVVVCLQESSLLTCITIASRIRAWVYPLIYEPVHTPDHTHRLLGAYDQEGEFCADTDESKKTEEVTADLKKAIKRQRASAIKSIKRQADDYGLQPDASRLDGRDVILAADIITSTLPIRVARQLLANASPRSVTAVIGNATPETAQLTRLSAGETHIMDILSGVVFDHHHYFEHDDEYTTEQKQTLVQHIATYWR